MKLYLFFSPTSETTSKKKVLEGDEPDTEDAAINVSKCKDEEQMVPLEKMKTLCKKVEKFASQHNMTDTAVSTKLI
ncbi:hypothetical protein Pmani_007445 [Petrolisthes manimaculis]|uniref:Uncharacterized protein n=1 Tax=Petrolisthes manimaculis TaxID=1843537 RepID=A0AAE1Q8H3_9EUCA|nr:hypothetical protein Pmani_007445 [Petrolisthes manimaculis]